LPPSFLVLKSRLNSSYRRINEVVYLLFDRLAAEAKPAAPVFNCVSEPANAMHNAGLAVSHRVHLTDPARFIRTGHEEQVAIRVKGIGALWGESIEKNKIRVTAACVSQELFVFCLSSAENQADTTVAQVLQDALQP
jgi:hypothetical protein